MDSKREASKRSKSFFSQRRLIGFSFGIAIGILAVFALLAPQNERLHVLGPMTVGHEDMKCKTCHADSKGTLRQQLQANARYILGMRHSLVDFGKTNVGNDTCLKCHNRSNERHPVYRFNEPRYAKVRKELAPQNCVSCHQEHLGKRVTQTNITFCSSCHKETKLRNDPLDISHTQLIAKNQWNTCLGCHDFHGNHEMQVSKDTKTTIKTETILRYLDGTAPSPYSNKKRFEAKKETSL